MPAPWPPGPEEGQRLDPNPTQQKIIGFKMPVDRDMDPKDKKRLMELIEKLYGETH